MKTSANAVRACAFNRRGNVIVLAAAVMIMIFGFAAFVVDMGYIALTKGQLQNASDSASLAAAIELRDGLSGDPKITQAQVGTNARSAAVAVAAVHANGNMSSTYLHSTEDVKLGNRFYNSTTAQWENNWGAQPYNVVEVKANRSNARSNALPLFFAPVIKVSHAQIYVDALSRSAFYPGGGFQVPPGSNQTPDILPFALDLGTWQDLVDRGIGTDNYTVRADGTVVSGGDGILEVNLYPHKNTKLPPGNRGTVDLGSNNNSTADISRQILHGLNDYDFSFFPDNTIRWDNGPLYLQGDTGVSAGFKDELEAIKGQPRAIPIFTSVSGNGNNATYTVVKFVGIRIVSVRLTGGPDSRHLMVQPTPFYDPTVLRTTTPLKFESILTTPEMVN